MDIKLINPNVLAYMDAVKDCNERGKFRLSGDKQKIGVQEYKPLEGRVVSDIETLYENGNLRTGLLIAMRDELLSEKIDLGDGRVKDLSDGGRRLAERKLADLTKPLRAAGANDDLDAAEVKQILTELKTVKDQVVGLSDRFSDWEVDDDPDAREEEWQSVVRGHNPDVKPTVGQKNLLIYGKTDALARALDISEDEVARLSFDQFAQASDGTITFRVFGDDGADGAAFEPRTVRLTVGGFIEPADGHKAERDELNKLISDGSFVFGLENPAASFRASDLNDVKAFLRFFASKPGLMDNLDHRNRTSVFNMLPDALRLVHDLRRQGKLSVGPISPETWWKCLGLKGKFPGGQGQMLARAFNAAVREKTVDDFLEAKGWNRIEGMKTWIASGYEDKHKPAKWSQVFVDMLFGPFCATTGYTYSQKLALLKTKGCALSDVNLFFRPLTRAGSASTSRYRGVSIRMPKDGMIPAAMGREDAWDSFAVSDHKREYAEQTNALRKRGFSDQQIDRILPIVDADADIVPGLGVFSPNTMMKIEVEKSGENMLLAIRQPALRPISEGPSKAECKYELRADDVVRRFVVRPDGSYEMSGLSFEKVRESAQIIDGTMLDRK